MPPGKSTMSYYKSESDQVNGKDALGCIDSAGATVFLKEVSKSGVSRFTVHTPTRELKLRAESEADYRKWVTAIKPYAASFAEEVEEDAGGGGDRSSRARGITMADGDSSSDD